MLKYQTDETIKTSIEIAEYISSNDREERDYMEWCDENGFLRFDY